MEMTIKTLQAMRLAAVPHQGPYQQIGPAFQKLGAIAGPAGLFTPTAKMIGLYRDDPRVTPAADLRSAAAVTIADGQNMPAGLVEEHIEGGRFACFLHIGPYEGLPNAWAEAIGTFLAKGHRRREGPSLEFYLNHPMQVAPAALETEIAIPID